MTRQFDIILQETSTVYEKVIHLQVALAVSFFVLFLLGYFTFSFFFARSISRPIVDVSLRLNSFIGQSIERTSVAHRNEIELLDHSVTTLIDHYTYLSRIARTLADGDIESASSEIPKTGIVGSALGEISDYLHHMAEASAWIRDGKYGAMVELKSDKDVLGQTFNIMSSVVHEKISTLSRVFDSIEEGLLVIDASGVIVESNNRLLRLLELHSIGDLADAGGLARFMKDYSQFHRKLLRGHLKENSSATMLTSRGVHVPVRVTARALEPIEGKASTFMLFISNESWRVRMKRERERLKSQAVLAELKSLRAQIDPHFLFNTLNTIAQLVETNPDHAVDTIEKLADLFRYTLATTDRETVPVAEELKHIRDYVEIEQTRFEGNLSVGYRIDGSVESQSMPPMLLQPIVENALRHGKDKEGKVHLSIQAEWHGDDVVFCIGDHGTASQVRDFYSGRGIGLKNVNNRLKTLYNSSIQIRPNTPTGVVVSVSIPGGRNGDPNAHSGR
jgi:PAS domain-containing protein